MLTGTISYFHQTIPLDVIRPYFTYISNRTTQTPITIGALEKVRFVGDLFGLLNHYSIPASMWAMILLLNNFEHPGQYTGQDTLLTIEQKEYMTLISTLSLTKRR